MKVHLDSSEFHQSSSIVQTIIHCARLWIATSSYKLCHACIISCIIRYSLLKMPLDVVIVNTDSDGFLSREELRVDAVFDQTLRESLSAATPMLKEPTEYGSTTEPLVCYEGNSKVAIMMIAISLATKTS